jgi:hypothetical protein
VKPESFARNGHVMSPVAILVVLLIATLAALVFLARSWIQQKRELRMFGPVINAEQEAAELINRARAEVVAMTAHRTAAAEDARNAAGRAQQLELAIAEMSAEFEAIASELQVESSGVYEPVFDFEDPESFRDAIKALRVSQKELIKRRAAIQQSQVWLVNNSEKEGSVFIRNIERLVMLAFNGECDALIGKVNSSNWEKSIARIHKTHEQLNKIIQGFFLELTYTYVHLRIQEMRAKYELELRRAEIKEAQKAAREEMREEKQRVQEIEREQKRLAKEEEREQTALNRARTELQQAHGEQRSALEAKILEMERLLADAQERTRSLSMAQQTRVGHVYIVSNIGSFGENLFKVGMTRRLDPTDRVKELSDASVPFPFDIHAIIKTQDAPALESELHNALNGRRVNRVNHRKEFFRATLDEIVGLVNRHHGQIEFVRDAGAEQFRQTMALIRAEAVATQTTSRSA